MNKEKELIDKLIDLAFSEDIGDGDHTTEDTEGAEILFSLMKRG